MIYLNQEDVLIRSIQQEDAQIICGEEIAQGWDQSIEKYLKRIEDYKSGKCVSLVAEYQGKVAGYVNVYPDCKWGPFGNQGLPEIVDFGVLEKYRGRGIGTKLMDVAEQVAKEFADMVYLGVGLHSGYGSAQRMYVKRGYIPDGSGVWYDNSVCKPYANCCNDDELVLYFSKQL